MRKKHSLDGAWQFQVDASEKGQKDKWFMNGLPDSTAIMVPHIWQTDEKYVTYSGAAWYEKELNIGVKQDDIQYWLHFDAVDYEASVWLNGQYLGRHEGGFTPFSYNVTAVLKSNINKVTVRVYDPNDNAEIPIGKQGSWYTRVSGIWQSVYIEERREQFIESALVTPIIKENAVSVKTETHGVTEDAELTFLISEHLNKELIFKEETQIIKEQQSNIQLSWKDINLWSPDSPYLYDLTIILKKDGEVLDEYEVTFGMREVTYRDGMVYLNGEPLYIRGALDQSFYPDTVYNPPSEEWIIDEINKAKHMGFNMLRKHIKIEVPEYLYWADRLGMLIWEEPPNIVKWSKQANNRFRNELMEMIKRDYNHPSIIFWSIYNEEWGLEWDLANDKEKQLYVEALYNEVTTLDPIRLVCDNSGWTHVKTDINDHHRYFTLPEQLNEWREDIKDYMIGNPAKNYVGENFSRQEPIIVSEFGVWGLPDPQEMTNYYGHQPRWYENLGDETHKEDFKRPLTLMENFKKYQLNKVFKDYKELSLHSQRRQFRANQALIEEMRKEPGLNGYIVTEFTDIEWETNGWMTYSRKIKAPFNNAARFNGSLIVMADLVKRNYWADETATVDLIISNNDQKALKGVLSWELTNLGIKGEISIKGGNKLHTKLPGAIELKFPEVNSPLQEELLLTLSLETGDIAENTIELTVSPLLEQSKTEKTIFTAELPVSFQEHLRSHGYTLTDKLEKADLAICSVLTPRLQEAYENGKNVIFLAEDGDNIPEKGLYTFRQLDLGESWNRTSSFNYVNVDHFKGLPLQKEMGWEFEGIYPDYVLPLTNYEKVGGTVGRIVYMFGNDSIINTSDIISGYFQGWAGQVGASLIRKYNSSSTFTLTTWKLINNYGEHPVATAIINHLIEQVQPAAAELQRN